MSSDPRIKGVAILAAAGLLLVGVVLFLFYGLPEPSSRSETFPFTAWFSAGQVFLLFSALIYTAIKDGHPGSVIPVNSATVVATFIYNVATVLTMLLFTQLLLPYRCSARTYYVCCIGELGIAASYAVMLQLVAVAHRVGHAEAVESRASIQDLARKCEAISLDAVSIRGTLDLRQCSELIRFSEGLRRDPALTNEVHRLLCELEELANSGTGEPGTGEAKRLIGRIEALARRQS